MKKSISASIIILIIALAINHGAKTLNRIEKNVHASFLEDCDPYTVKLEKSDLFELPTEVTVWGRNCAGPDTAYQGYTAQIWDHGFWLL